MRRDRQHPEGFVIRTVQSLRRRPWLAPALGAALAALALLVPFSYQKTTGYDVSLELSGPTAVSVGASLAPALAKSLGAPSASMTAGGEGVTLQARVPLLQSAGLATRAEGFAKELIARGIPARARITPVVETVSGNLYAMTRDRVIDINIQADGRTTAEIEAQIRDQLQSAGISDAQVSVTKQGDNTQIQISAHPAPNSDGTSEINQVNVTVDGAQGSSNTRRAEIHMEPGQTMTDAEIEASLEAQLRAQGTEVDAVVQNGKVVSITPIKK